MIKYRLDNDEEYDDYEDFCESEGKLCSKEEFESLQDKEAYIIEGKEGNALVESIPLIYHL